MHTTYLFVYLIHAFNCIYTRIYRETQLSKRVSDWTRRLEPVLRQQEESAAFDIHVYADNVLAQVSLTCTTQATSHIHTTAEKGQNYDPSIVGIEDITGGLSSSEVSRTFLACLQLANLGNIDIIVPDLPTHELPAPHPLQKPKNNTKSSTSSSTNSTTIMYVKEEEPVRLFKLQLLNDKRLVNHTLSSPSSSSGADSAAADENVQLSHLQIPVPVPTTTGCSKGKKGTKSKKGSSHSYDGGKMTKENMSVEI